MEKGRTEEEWADHISEYFFELASIIAGLPDRLNDAKELFYNNMEQFEKMEKYLKGDSNVFGHPLSVEEYAARMRNLLYVRCSIFKISQKIKNFYDHIHPSKIENRDYVANYIATSFEKNLKKPRWKKLPLIMTKTNTPIGIGYFSSITNKSTINEKMFHDEVEKDIISLQKRHTEIYSDMDLIYRLLDIIQIFTNQPRDYDENKNIRKRNKLSTDALLDRLNPAEYARKYYSGEYMVDPEKIGFDEVFDYLDFRLDDDHHNYNPYIFDNSNDAGEIKIVYDSDYFSFKNWGWITKYDHVFQMALEYEAKTGISKMWHNEAYNSPDAWYDTYTEFSPQLSAIEFSYCGSFLTRCAERRDEYAFRKPDPLFYLELLPMREIITETANGKELQIAQTPWDDKYPYHSIYEKNDFQGFSKVRKSKVEFTF